MPKKFIIFLASLCLICNIAFAHPGRTDSNGGHWNRSTGTYHYHNGSSSSSGGSSYSYSKSTPLPWQGLWSELSKSNAVPTSEPDKTSSSKAIDKVFPWLLISVIPCILIFRFIKDSIEGRNERKRKEEERLQMLELEKQRKEDEKRKEIEELTTHSLRELSGMPDFAEIGKDGLPKIKGEDEWGEYFTRYIYSSSSYAYHKKTCRYAYFKIHVAKPGNACYPCGVCKPEKAPDLTWYKKYKDIKCKCEQYNVAPLPDD